MKQMHTANCLIIYSKSALRLIRYEIQKYYINSKGCYYIYFRQKDQMREIMRKFDYEGVKYSKRQSVLPTPQEYEDTVDHCIYKQQKEQKIISKKHNTTQIRKQNSSNPYNSSILRDQQPMFHYNLQRSQQRPKNKQNNNQQFQRHKLINMDQYNRKYRTDPFGPQDNPNNFFYQQENFSPNKKQIVNKLMLNDVKLIDKKAQAQQSKCNQELTMPSSIKHILTNKILMNEIFLSFQ